jgi:hypothetical protein
MLKFWFPTPPSLQGDVLGRFGSLKQIEAQLRSFDGDLQPVPKIITSNGDTAALSPVTAVESCEGRGNTSEGTARPFSS